MGTPAFGTGFLNQWTERTSRGPSRRDISKDFERPWRLMPELGNASYLKEVKTWALCEYINGIFFCERGMI